jgi:hypothetical protein
MFFRLNPKNNSDSDQVKRRTKYQPLLAILVLALATLACINTEVSLKVTNREDGTDTLVATFEQYLTDSFIAAAKVVNEERRRDFAAAGRETDTENLLPVTMAEAGELFDPGKYQDEGYTVTTSNTGFKATKQFQLLEQESSDNWQVLAIREVESGDVHYQAKVWLDLSEMDGDDLFALRTEEDIKRPSLEPGAYDSGSSSGGWEGLFAAFGDMTAEAEQELAIELHYVQKALKQSDPIEYKIVVELPGQITNHTLNGDETGVLVGNQVTLVITESIMRQYAGQKIEFRVESKLKNCSGACQSAPNLIWDGKAEGDECNCVCEKGFEIAAGEETCINCETICSSSDPNREADLPACEINQCACRCKAGYQMNKAGTKCITVAEAEAEDRENAELTDPSPSGSNQDQDGSNISPAALFANLEEFLAGEGITAPTPGMMAASGAALTSLLGAWLVMNLLSGISPQQSLEVIEAWSEGAKPPSEVDLTGPSPTEGTDRPEEATTTSGQRTPVQEGGEDQAVRHIKNVKDIGDAIKQTRADIEALEGRIPDRIKNTDTWKNNVEPHIKNIKNYIKQDDLDKARDWLDRVENLIELREEVVSDLDHLTPDKQEAMVWTERTIKALGHIASDTYQTVVVDPAKAAGEALLPEDLQKPFTEAMDELGQEMSNTAQEIGELPRKGAELFTHKNQLEHAPDYIKEELYGPRDVPVEYPDFWGKGTRKVSELYNGTKNLLFGD